MGCFGRGEPSVSSVFLVWVSPASHTCRTNIWFQSAIQKKIIPLAKKKLVEYLGELDDDDMVVFIADHVRARKPPQELVESLEPVSFPHLRPLPNTIAPLPCSTTYFQYPPS